MPDHDLPGVRFPPPLLYIGGFLVGLALELAFPVGELPVGLAVALGVLCLLVFLVLDGAAMARFFRAKTSVIPAKPTTALVTSGPYRFTRNPMYLGMAFLYAGFAFGFGVFWAFALLPLVLLIVDRVVIPPEESFLRAHFGEEFAQYSARVRRWV